MRYLFFLFFAYYVTGQCFGQATAVYRNLVMERGGIRGIAYSGAILELEQSGMLDSIIRVGGTSAGAIQAALLAVGYSADEIKQLIYAMPVKKMNDGRFVFIGGSNRLVKYYGWYRGEKFTKWLEEQLKAKTGLDNITLGQLHTMAGPNGMRDLYVTGTNLTQQKVEVLSYETYPAMKVSDAVRISMSIPLYFKAMFIDSLGNTIAKPATGQKVNVMVDGGILANYPIDLFDQNKYLYRPQPELSSDTYVFNPETLGLRLDREEQITYDTQQKGLAPYEIYNFKSYMSAFYTIVSENLNRNKLKTEDWRRTISINTLNFGPKIKHLSKAEKEQLMESGRFGTIGFLHKK
ncbi:patatin-like phospholipase family protein [Cytophagaceae bacterium YF14B1]|uniref:Patatin-like phospholipase family protein n=1 Tax=Xanthocytophaga flava TaxID=3048013 RepID=A0AAE3QSS1_9BACT|nr:patatin-like phospholipase family protein [Xanthocytophaga flavus]MDJ1484680.1 patatin-like phospholipase family protein [Xanthocytophaga flavus]